MSQNKRLSISSRNGNGPKIIAILAFIALGLTIACEQDPLEDPDSSLTGAVSKNSSDYNTIEECEAIFHRGDGWKSLCDGHGGWGNPNRDASKNQTCKQVDCERNAEHDVSPYFFPSGCYCKDGYTGPDPDGDLDPLPPGCEDAMAGKDTFCQKDESCRGAGTRTVNGYSCRDVDKGFGPLVCSGMFSDRQWKQMRDDCCFDEDDDGGSADSCMTPEEACGSLQWTPSAAPDYCAIIARQLQSGKEDICREGQKNKGPCCKPEQSDPNPDNPCAGAVCDRKGKLKCSELDVLDVVFYGTHYPDLEDAFHGDVGALQNHYLKHGIREGRRPNAFFSPQTYLSVNKDVANVFGSKNYAGALEHWITYGMRECRPLK